MHQISSVTLAYSLMETTALASGVKSLEQAWINPNTMSANMPKKTRKPIRRFLCCALAQESHQVEERLDVVSAPHFRHFMVRPFRWKICRSGSAIGHAKVQFSRSEESRVGKHCRQK